MLSAAQIEQRRLAGRARAKQFTRSSQRHARRHRTSESLSAAGKIGAKVTMERHGLQKMAEMARQHRLKNPSRWELQTIGILARLNVKYEREFVICREKFYTIDFWLPEASLAIEVHGEIHDPGKPNYRRRLQNDRLKRELLRSQNRRILTLHHSEFANLANVIERIRLAMEQK